MRKHPRVRTIMGVTTLIVVASLMVAVVSTVTASTPPPSPSTHQAVVGGSGRGWATAEQAAIRAGARPPTMAQVVAHMTPAQRQQWQVDAAEGRKAIQADHNLLPTVDHHPGTGTGVHPVVSVTFGWVVYVHFTHADVASTVFLAALSGVNGALNFACFAVGLIDVGAGALCALNILIDSSAMWFLIAVANAQSTTHPAFWCGSFIPPHGFNWTACNAIGGIGEYGAPYLAWNPFLSYYEWVYNAHDTGVTMDLFYVTGTLAGWTMDEPSCPCGG